MASVELEAPGVGWVGSLGFTERGELVVLEARDPDWQTTLTLLLADLLTQPAPSGRVLGGHVSAEDPDLLYELAELFVRRKPWCRGYRLRGSVAGGGCSVNLPDEPNEPGDEW